MNKSSSSHIANRMIVVIGLALLLWGSVIAWGVVRNQAELDVRKPLVIVGVVILFLVSWVFLLRSFQTKNH